MVPTAAAAMARSTPIAVTYSGRALVPRATAVAGAPTNAVLATPITGTPR